jgi:hypothetical protein
MNILFNNYNDDTSGSTSDGDDTASTTSVSSYSSNDDSDDNYDIDDYDSNVLLNRFHVSNKNVLLIPELYNKYIHGKTNDSDPKIDSHFIVLESFQLKSNNNNNIINLFKHINEMCNFYKVYYKRNFYNLSFGHKLIRNYNNIIKKSSYLNVEIGQIYYLKGDECVCIIKTFWIKIIQRAWKKIYANRKRLYQLRNRPDSLFYRQVTGKWPDYCNFIPSVKGMLI